MHAARFFFSMLLYACHAAYRRIGSAYSGIIRHAMHQDMNQEEMPCFRLLKHIVDHRTTNFHNNFHSPEKERNINSIITWCSFRSCIYI